MTMHHRDMPAQYVHAPYSWVVPNIAARDAIIDLQADDIGKFIRVTQDESIYKLTSLNPTVWGGIGGGGTPGAGSVTGDMLNTALVNTVRYVTIGGSRFALLPMTGDDVVANLRLRTGTLASLQALGGGNGELACATDVAAVVKFNGVAGQAQTLAAFGFGKRVAGTDRGTVNPVGNVAEANKVQPVVFPDAQRILLEKGVAGSNPIFPLAQGYIYGQEVVVSADLPLTMRVNTSSGTQDYQFLGRTSVTLYVETDGYWKLKARGYENYPTDAASFMGGASAATGSVALGPKAQALMPWSTAVGNNTATAFINETALSRGQANIKGYKSIVNVCGKTTTSAQQLVLTTDGLTAGLTNVLYREDESCVMEIDATVVGRIQGTTNVFARFKRRVTISYDKAAGTYTLHATVNPGMPDDTIVGTMAGATVAITASASNGVEVKVTGPTTAAAVEWAAILTVDSLIWSKV